MRGIIMNQKIKFLRETLGLTEKEISSFLNISSYKYTSFEKAMTIIPCDILILLSKIYGINIELLLDSKYNNEDLFSELKRQEIFFEDKSVILEKLRQNLFQNRQGLPQNKAALRKPQCCPLLWRHSGGRDCEKLRSGCR